MRLAIALLLAAPFCVAQDARASVVRAVAAWDRNDRLMLDYTYKVRDEVRELDAGGRVKSDRSTLDEVLYIGGKRYFRPLEKDGQPLSAARATSETSSGSRERRERAQ